MHSCFRYDIGIESITEIDRVDVITTQYPSAMLHVLGIDLQAPENVHVPFQIAVHYCEEHL